MTQSNIRDRFYSCTNFKLIFRFLTCNYFSKHSMFIKTSPYMQKILVKTNNFKSTHRLNDVHHINNEYVYFSAVRPNLSDRDCQLTVLVHTNYLMCDKILLTLIIICLAVPFLFGTKTALLRYK